MFTGIITLVGKIDKVVPILSDKSSGVRVTIIANKNYLSDISIGDSIAVQGACMTVVDKLEDKFYIDVSNESLSCTYGLNIINNEVNLEKSMKLGDRISGHMVYGHIDCIGKVKSSTPIGESLNLLIQIPNDYLFYFVPKCSVSINGVSLTVNEVINGKNLNDFFDVSLNIIPHTLSNTNLKDLKKSTSVNIEIDIVARYLIQFAKNNS